MRLQPWRLHAIFGHLEELLTHLAQGDRISETASGQLLHPSRKDGEVYGSIDLVRIYIEIFTIARQRDAACPDDMPLHELAQRLEADTLDAEALDAALACYKALRTYVAGKRWRDMSDVLRTAEIKAWMDEPDE
jgi:hypothetical protein